MLNKSDAVTKLKLRANVTLMVMNDTYLADNGLNQVLGLFMYNPYNCFVASNFRCWVQGRDAGN